MLPLPRWARAMDGIALATLALGLVLLVSGGVLVSLATWRLSLRSGELLFAGAALLAIRHAALPRDPIHRRIRAWMSADRASSARPIAVGALASRVAILLVGYFAVLTIGINQANVGFSTSADPLFDLPARFDAGWYAGIALNGYTFEGRFDRQQNVAFFPAFPLLMRAAGVFVGAREPGVPTSRRGGRLLWGGVLLSIGAFIWAAAYLLWLARALGAGDRSTDAVLLLAAYPFALYFSAPYTEALYLLGAVAACYHFVRRDWLRAAAWGVLVGLTRPNGCFLSVVLALIAIEAAWRARSSPPAPYPIVPAIAAAAGPGIGMLAFSAFAKHLTGSWFGWARLHEAWGRSFQGLAPAEHGVAWIAREGLLRVFAAAPIDTMNALALLFALVMVWPVWRRLGAPWAAFILITVVPPFFAGGLLSMGRVTATLFPVFIALACVLPRRAIGPALIAFGAAQGFAAVLFFTWHPLY